jgi:type I restriction enzyme S subunit
MEATVTKATFQKYPAYKDSGVEWLGTIPEHWEIYPGLKFIAENKSKNTGMIRNTVLSLSYGKIRIKQDDELTGLVPESFETYQLVNKGDLIFRPTDLQNDKVSLRSAYSEYEGIITNAYLNLKFRQIADSKFFHYFFRAIDNNKIIYGLGSGLRQNISYLDFRRFLFPFPPLPEQTAIATFLDDKTAKIDRAIAQKEKMIALLRERKQIIIQDLVTGKKVWNEKQNAWTEPAEVKDSGVEWMGLIPEHWDMLANKFIFKIKKNLVGKKSNQYTLLSLTLNGIIKRDMENPQGKFPAEFDTYQEVNNGDFVFCLFDVEETPRCVGLSDFDGMITGAYTVIQVGSKFDKSFLYYFYLNLDKDKRLRPLYTGLRNTISKDNFFAFKAFVPPLPEQTAIATHIETQSAKIDKAIKLQEQQIEKLKELKSTLIDSAVTGKIKII